MSSFNLTGCVTGSKAAIYLSENALVDWINVMQGAQITGDIISNYLEVDEDGDLRLTNLTFSDAADENGNATSAANQWRQHHIDWRSSVLQPDNRAG